MRWGNNEAVTFHESSTLGGRQSVLRTKLSAIRSNCSRSSRHILAAFTFAALSSFGSINCTLTTHEFCYCRLPYNTENHQWKVGIEGISLSAGRETNQILRFEHSWLPDNCSIGRGWSQKTREIRVIMRDEGNLFTPSNYMYRLFSKSQYSPHNSANWLLPAVTLFSNLRF